MKTSLLTSALVSVLALTACSQAEAPKTSTVKTETVPVKAVKTKTKAVLVYADWCGSCKVLDPKIKRAQALGPVPGLEYVTLDYTAKDAKAFYAQADAAGVGKAVKAYLNGTVKTGQLLLVDMNDQKVIGKVTKDLDAGEIQAAVKAAVKAS